jgi:subtilisin family serine protease
MALDGGSLARSRQLTEQALEPLRRDGTLELVEPSPAILAARVTLPAGASVADAIATLRRDVRVESVVEDQAIQVLPAYSAEEFVPNATARTVNAASSHADALFPNDPLLLPQLWHYNLVDAPRAWRTVTGSDQVLVAVVDDGIRFDHPAIAANLTDDGYNFVTAGPWLPEPEPLCVGNAVIGTTDIPEAGYGPDPTAPDDIRWTGSCWQRSTLGNHGLHVAGTIGAVGNDGVGVAGLNWSVRIRPVRVLGMIGAGFSFDVAQGVLYAAGLPASDGEGGTVTAPSAARIINMSLGSATATPVIRDAVAAAIQAGSLVIASMGNAQSANPNFPAAYPDVMGIVAIGPDLQLSSYTNVGPAASLSAPGGNPRSSPTSGVVSTTWNFVTGAPNYAYYNGTSMAAPHVAGVAALLLAANPGMNRAQLRTRLESTAVPLGSPGRDDRFGWGAVNAYRAIHNITAATHPTFVRVHSAVTGDTVRTAAVGANGTFSFPRLPEGNYHVVAGETEAAAGRVAFRGLRYGWFGDDRGPAVVTVHAEQSPSPTVALHIGTPRESKPNNTRETANRLLVNSYVLGHVNQTHPEAFFQVPVPTAGRYTFETAGIVGTCGYGIEVNTTLTLMSADGAVIAQNVDTPMPGSAFCSRIEADLAPGTYFVRVTGTSGARGQFALSVRR